MILTMSSPTDLLVKETKGHSNITQHPSLKYFYREDIIQHFLGRALNDAILSAFPVVSYVCFMFPVQQSHHANDNSCDNHHFLIFSRCCIILQVFSS